MTVTENVGPGFATRAKEPAHTPIETGESVAELAASDTGTPLGVSKTNPFPVEGQAPGERLLVTEGLSGTDPWLSMQKYSSCAPPPCVRFQNTDVGLLV